MKIILPDGSVEEAKDELRAIRHTASHVLAQAVKRLYPETKLAIGPAIDDGFYYDFDREGGFTPDDLEKLEAEMKKIVKENLALKPFLSRYNQSSYSLSAVFLIRYTLIYHFSTFREQQP